LQKLERKLEIPRTLRVMSKEPYKPRIFISHAHADEPENPRGDETKWLTFVTGYLRPALKQGAVEIWIDRLIGGGDAWNPEIERRLRDCDIFILLVSPNSLSSDYVVDKEIAAIRERQANREDVHFYPLVLTPTPEAGLDLVRDLNLRPRDGKPFSDYPLNDRFRHMNEAANEIAAIAKEIVERRAAAPPTTRPEAAKNQSEKLALSNIPISVPLHFLGRDDELAAIDAALEGEKGRVAALYGLRGVGKSTLAAAHAERHRANYRATWWIRAQTPDTMRADLASLGVRLGWVAPDEKEEPALAAVRERLRNEGDGLLLIYDNAIDAASLRPYLPSTGAARAVVTSNSPAWRAVATLVEIRVWAKEVGADYLIARTGRERERADAEALSEMLGGLTLAHEQAAAYCERVGVSFAEYRKRFESAAARLLDAAQDAPAEYGLTVAKAFALAIDEAAKMHPAAESLITYAAQLAPEPIPLFLFSEARETFGEPLSSKLAGEGLDEAVAALRAFALVDRETIPDERDPATTTGTVRLHRLVRTVAADRLQGESAEAARRILIEALAAVYPSKVFNDPIAWPRARRLDVLVLDLLGGAASPAIGAEMSAAYLLDRLGSYRQGALGAYSQARPLLERALAISEKAVGLESSATAARLNNLAGLLWAQGNFAGARPLCERALTITEKASGAEHPNTATSLNNLALLLRDQGDFAGARPLFERALAIMEKTRGPEHPDTANSLNSLALVLTDQGDLERARRLFERALAIFGKALLDPEDPRTNRTRANLAKLRLDQGAHSEALALSEAALAAHDKVLGANHPWTQESAQVTADVLDALGRAGEAAALRTRYEL
jgi:tetratricopeptide (TPR) repeat protein